MVFHALQPNGMMQVTEGCGRVLVLAVGVNSEWGKTMAMCQSEPWATPLQQQLEKMAGGIAKLGLGVAVVCFVVLLLRSACNLKKREVSRRNTDHAFWHWSKQKPPS